MFIYKEREFVSGNVERQCEFMPCLNPTGEKYMFHSSRPKAAIIMLRERYGAKQQVNHIQESCVRKNTFNALTGT